MEALLVIDVQKDYFRGGKMELAGSIEAAERICTLVSLFRKKGSPVIHVQHISVRPGASFFAPGTEGVEFHERVLPMEGEKVFRKNYPNAFRETGLEDYCREMGIGRVVIVGMMTHMCIDATVRAAFDLGFECILLGDCCATRDLTWGGRTVMAGDVQASFLASVNGTFAKVLDSEGFIASRI